MIIDEYFMQCAIAVGEKARLLSPPNPWVGCVLVKGNQIIAEGFTQPPGLEHAEAMALKAAGGNARGSTVYVTLEPCAHFGRTPPCSKALINAGVARVVIAVVDPDPLVCGKGIQEIKEAGIEVTSGVCQSEAEYSLRSYLFHRRTGKAFCLIKSAISIDGRVAAGDGSSKWITCEEARRDAHLFRAQSQAIMVGSGTAIMDQPSLNVRIPLKSHNQPLRIIMDRRGQVPPSGPLFDNKLAPTLIMTSHAVNKETVHAWEEKNIMIHYISEEEPFESVLTYLGSKGIIQLMVEGGPNLHSSILKENACREMIIYLGSICLGDQGKASFCNMPIPSIEKAIKLNLKQVKKIGNSTRLDYLI